MDNSKGSLRNSDGSSSSVMDATASPSDSEANQPVKVYQLTVPWEQINVGKFMALISAAYLLEDTLHHPFDVLRTRLQVNRTESFTLLKTFSLARSLGRKGLYAGFGTGAIGNLPCNAIYYTGYNFFKSKLQAVHEHYFKKDETQVGKQAIWVSFGAGALADVLYTSVYTPVEVVVQRLQLQDQKNKRYKNGFHAVQEIFRREGLRGFYRGVGATLVTTGTAASVSWTVYERLKVVFSELLDFNKSRSVNGEVRVVEQHPLAQLMAGTCSGIVTSVVVNPLDVVRTRLQTQHYTYSLKNEKHLMYKNMFTGLRTMVREEGFRVLFRGIGPKIAMSSISHGVNSIIYEFVLSLCTKPPNNDKVR